MSGERNTANVETLTAEVRVLMVGNRQVTMSVLRQLDVVRAAAILPFGRVKDPTVIRGPYGELIEDRVTVVGVVKDGYKNAGVLVRARCSPNPSYPRAWSDLPLDERNRLYATARATTTALYEEWCDLPLIVLAGLR